MKSRLIIGGVILFSLVSTQAIWFSKAYDASATQFDHSVSVALFSVADTMSENAIVEKRSSNYFYVKMNCPASSQVIDTMIQKEFLIRDLALDYELGVYNAEDDSLVHGKYVSASAPTLAREADDRELNLCNKDFAVLFPEKESYLVSQLDLWIYSSLVLIIISSVFVHFLAGTKHTNTPGTKKSMSLGNSHLDLHNRKLIVNGIVYQLTYKEFSILKLFFEHPNEVIERYVFLQKVWEKDGFFVERSMDVFISRIRKYLRADHSIKIENLRSIGYRLCVL